MKTIYLLFLLFIGYNAFSQSSDNPIYISSISIIDVKEEKVIPRQYVLIEDGEIKSISSTPMEQNKNLISIDGRGKFLIPGLWDMHTHYSWEYEFANPLLLANGVTGIREMWGIIDTVKYIRKQVAEGNLYAPEIYSAGNIVDGVPAIWPGSASIKSPEEGIQEVVNQAKIGVDFIKVYSNLDSASYMAIAKASKEKNIPFAGHIPSSISFEEAIDAGQQSVEHLYGLLEACTSQPERLPEFTGWKRFSTEYYDFLMDNFDQTKFEILCEKLAASDTWVSPTLIVLKQLATANDTTKVNDPRMVYMPNTFKEMWNPKNDFRLAYTPKEHFPVAFKRFRMEQKLVGEMQKNGVKIVAGTDYSNPYCFPGFSIHEELALLVEGGLTPIEALQCATINAAMLMDKEGLYGSVETGKTAHLVILNSNPIKNINATSDIDGVILNQKYFDSKGIENLLEKAKEIAKKP